MRTFQSRRACQDAPGQWDGANSPEAKSRARAAATHRRAEQHADLPEPYRGPAPGSVWRRITVTDEAGDVLPQCELRIPLGRARCDQFAEVRDGAEQPRMTNATAVGRLIAERVGKPPSVAMLADMQREETAES